MGHNGSTAVRHQDGKKGVLGSPGAGTGTAARMACTAPWAMMKRAIRIRKNVGDMGESFLKLMDYSNRSFSY
jgi:hypothetical protein